MEGAFGGGINMAEETMKTRSIRATDEAFNALKQCLSLSGEFCESR